MTTYTKCSLNFFSVHRLNLNNKDFTAILPLILSHKMCQMLKEEKKQKWKEASFGNTDLCVRMIYRNVDLPKGQAI